MDLKENENGSLEENLKEESQKLELSQTPEPVQKSEIPELPKIDIELTPSQPQKQQPTAPADKKLNSDQAVLDAVSKEPKIEEEISLEKETRASNHFGKENTPEESEKSPNETKPDKSAAAFHFNGWNIMSIISAILGCFFLFQGFDKMYHYYNGSYFSYDNVNAYVQGDAYNYIINGTYATAFFVLTAAFFLMAIGFQILRYLSKDKHE